MLFTVNERWIPVLKTFQVHLWLKRKKLFHTTLNFKSSSEIQSILWISNHPRTANWTHSERCTIGWGIDYKWHPAAMWIQFWECTRSTKQTCIWPPWDCVRAAIRRRSKARSRDSITWHVTKRKIWRFYGQHIHMGYGTVGRKATRGWNRNLGL